jgi:hypothetical protein
VVARPRGDTADSRSVWVMVVEVAMEVVVQAVARAHCSDPMGRVGSTLPLPWLLVKCDNKSVGVGGCC